MNEDVGVIGLFLYGLFLVSLVVLLIWMVSFYRFRSWKSFWESIPLFSPKTIFLVVIATFFVVRIIWLILSTWSDDPLSSFLVNRVAFSLFFTAFTLLLAFWIDVLHHFWDTGKGRTRDVQREPFFYSAWIRWIFIASNVLWYIIAFSLAMAFITQVSVKDEIEEEKEGNELYELNVHSILILHLLIAIAFLIYGIRLFWLASRHITFSTRLRRTYIAKIVALIGMITGCYIMRMIMFLYRPISGEFLPEGAFFPFAYYIPDLVPSAILCWIIVVTEHKAISQKMENEEMLGQKLYNHHQHNRHGRRKNRSRYAYGRMKDETDEDEVQTSEEYESPSRSSVALTEVSADEEAGERTSVLSTGSTAQEMDFGGT